jgi:hypothetical protein
MENSHYKLPKMDLQLKPIIFGKMEELKKVQLYLQEIEQESRKAVEKEREKDSSSSSRARGFRKKPTKD